MVSNAPRHVIYIEDDPQMIEFVVFVLTRRGYQVTGVRGGEKGLEAVAEDPPDLILLDLMMPGMDGWEVFQKLKADEDTRHIPVIVVTAKSQAIDRVLGLNIAKVDDYIAKPFRPQELVEHIDKVLSSHDVQDV